MTHIEMLSKQKEVVEKVNYPKTSKIIIKTAEDLKQLITNYPDFPKKGIQFKDISPILKYPQAMEFILAEIHRRTKDVDIVALIDSRGFLFNIPGMPSVMIRKKGKLPGDVERQRYKKEYGYDTIEIQKGIIQPGQRVMLIDDLLATGGTHNAGGKLIEKVGGEVAGVLSIVQINDPFCVAARKKKKLDRYSIHSLVEYDE